MKFAWATIANATLLAWACSAQAVVLFNDDFTTAVTSSANYALAQGGTNNQVTFAYDYSAMGIPAAPHTTDSSTLGVRFDVNRAATTVANGAVTLHTLQQFNGAYKVTFDSWQNSNGQITPAPGFPLGGVGSTQFLSAGVGGNGTAATPTALRGTTAGIGASTAVSGDGQGGTDYRMYKNNALQDPASTQYFAGTSGVAPDSRRSADPYYAQFGSINVSALPVQGANAAGGFAQQNGTSAPGSMAFAWHQVELLVNPTGGTAGAALMTWTIDGLKIGKIDAGIGSTVFTTNGSVMIGALDPSASLADAPALLFTLVDNVKVESVVANNADFDSSGTVDGADFLIWQKGQGLTAETGKTHGNANTDTLVDAADLGIWQSKFGGPPAVAAAGAVPEPTSWALSAGIAVLALSRGGLRRK